MMWAFMQWQKNVLGEELLGPGSFKVAKDCLWIDLVVFENQYIYSLEDGLEEGAQQKESTVLFMRRVIC